MRRAHGHGGKPDKIADGIHPDGSRENRPLPDHVQPGDTSFLNGHGPNAIYKM